ncbi:gamma-tubulin complex component 5 isoform X1 [Orussus abietinus]|uniref:gamma-tubulin complex component 5 isoform X1 n=1 Tax=Orussus abietinus TaxID=222816 RepID=UPI000C7161ED|nr:gamma-tubulin complex component 5 isoform X1 [Orussus abietinus]
MGTTILQDIYNDTKLLITTVTGFEDGEEGFRICERFALSNFKHHRFLSINSHSVKNYIDEMVKKFSIHGKYEVAKKFQDLVNSFLTSFDFEHHPQSDLQWALLSLVINLANETSKADLASLKLSTNEHSFDATVTIEEDESTTFDWGQYLKEGQEDFVCNYKSETESEWSDDETIQFSEVAKSVSIPPKKNVVSCVPTKVVQAEIDETSKVLVKQAEYRKWLLKNVQNTWWNELEYRHYPTNSPFPDAKFCYLWNNIVSKGLHFISTLSEYHIIRELLWMFHVQKPMVVFQEKNEADFFIRPNLSISSLSAVTFNSILLPFCEYFIMLHKMEQFGENLYIDHNLQQIHRSAPLTYEAYNAALSEHLFKLKSVVIDLEKSVMIQDDCNTMLSLSKDLKKHLKHIKMLYEIHRSVITDFQNSANWKCASNLLSGLYREMENSSSREKSNICASLYLRSIKVYLNIIDTWLSEGRLEDWRDEFVIARISESMKEDEGLYDSFVLRPLDPICLSDPIMQLLLYKVSHMGRSIELLVSLDRTSDMWSISAADVPRPPMSSEFLKEVLAEFTRYNADIVIDETDTSAPEIETCSKPKFDLDVDMHVTSQILKLNNPFLMKAYEKCLPCTLFNKDEVDTKPSGHTLITGQDDTVYKRLQSMSSSILPFRKVLESTLIKILDSRYQGVSKLVKNILIKEYKLEEQLKLMRCIYMMETGHIMHRFYQLVFSEIENSPIWNNSFYLTNILEEVLSHEWPDLSSRWSITVQNVRTHRVLNAVDKITLHYAAGWPMNMVLNKDALNKYNVIFRFQLKLKWALWTLNNLKFSDIEESKSTFISNKIQHFYTRRLENLRFWLLHAIGSIHAYLCGQVLQSLGFLFEKALKQCENLDDIITVHNEYLEKVHEHCLQTTDFEDLMATINNLLAMCIHVRDKWKRGSAALTAKDLDILEANYTNYHTYLALALHNAVQHKDADYLTALRSAFNCSMPCI